MLKFIKKLFVYEEPSKTDMEMGFELLEDPAESSSWGKKQDNRNNQKKENKEQAKSGEQEEGDPAEKQEQAEGGDQTVQKGQQKKAGDSQTGQEENEQKEAPKEQEENQSAEIKDQSKQEEEKEKEYLKTQLDVQNKLLNIIGSSIKDNENNNEKNKKSDMSDKETMPIAPKILIPKSIDKLAARRGRKHKENKKAKYNDEPPKVEDENNKTKEGNEEDKTKKENDNSKDEDKKSDGGNGKTYEQESDKKVSTSLDENIEYLKKRFHVPKNQDVIFREFNIAHKIPACVVFIDGMIDKSIIVEFTLPQLMDIDPFCDFEGGCPLDFIEKNVLPVHQMVRMKNYKEIIPQILSGLTIILIDGCDECIVMESRGFETRSIGSPVTETVVQGSQEGFTENMRTNITLVRRIIKNEDLITEFKIISKANNIPAALLYIDGITNPRIIKEIKRRVNSLDVEYISGSGMLEQLIEDKSLMIFPQVISTERPDRVGSFLMDGKAVLICEGTPFALAMPITFFDLYHTSEESNVRWQYGTFMRLVRIIGILLAALLPGMYTGLILFHQEMIPTSLLSSIIVSRAAVPFPTIIELLLMEFSFELIREGGIRVPGVTGNTLGIIGALILGQAAVQAGLVSPILIIIVAVSGLGSFAIPNYSLSLGVRIIRFILIIFGFLGGFYGISAGITIMFALALSMKSFGVPFFTPYAPSTNRNKDLILRSPIYNQKERPDFLNTENDMQMGNEPRGWKTTKEQEER